MGRVVLAYDFSHSVLYPHVSMDFKMNSVPVVVLVALVHYTAWWSQKGALTDALFSKRQAAFLQIQLPTFNVWSGDHLFEC